MYDLLSDVLDVSLSLCMILIECALWTDTHNNIFLLFCAWLLIRSENKATNINSDLVSKLQGQNDYDSHKQQLLSDTAQIKWTII